MKRLLILLVISFCISGVMANNGILKQKVNSIVVYWDASLSQKDKNVQKEFEFLDAFFKANTISKVQVVIFNSSVVSNKEITLKSSDWSSLRNQLSNVIYDGGSDFKLVNTELTTDLLFLFTDGKSNFGDFEASLYSPKIITVSSQANINKKFLHETAYYNRGYYINLLESDIPSSIKALKEEKTLPKLKFVTKVEVDKNYIQGIVSDELGVLRNANVIVQGKNITTITASDGSYTITAEPKDVLTFSYRNKKNATIELGNEKIINVQLQDVDNELDTVFIKTVESKEEDKKVNVGDRIVDKKSLGYSVQSIDSDDISGDEIDLGESLAGKVSGLQMGNNNDPGQAIIRGFDSFIGSNHPLFVIDGVPLPQSGVSQANKKPTDVVDPNNIANITVLKGLAATNRYGTTGRNGVILITTKTSVNKYTGAKEETDEPLKIEYKMFTSPLTIANQQNSGYIKMLKSITDIDKAYTHYLDKREQNIDNITYYVESSLHFFDEGEKEKGIRILSNLAEKYPNDTSVLKIMAFNLENHGLYEEAMMVYKRIVKISPSLSQAHLDLANIYSNGKEYQKSIDLFKKITNNKIQDIISFNGLQNQISNDFKGLLFKRDNTWKTKKIDPKYFTIPKYDLRVVVNWSHPQTEYELQYINQKKQYFILSHTLEKNKNVLAQELKEGYNSEEFVLSDVEKGEWYLNLIIPNQKTPDIKYPKFLKIKVYTNYGYKEEKLNTYIINLERISNSKLFASFKI
ncbi:TonB-dependent receptor plug domain-containing protein [Aquimarina sp. 2201CG5-10]|uniref:TonB-dependent receptor plug domain-containing protein n=1 Tax=Aquimarina callyspongiae TaxID=3098150 RepID=UPI002AB51609|nr:TonB-dependent receptor plug domain-containing protein [Aquimarina sp. 2201CG5-10]MDY8136201.1 TonB-dependent receptor plug domain-containing protein [Aquimarina sp. 2201CG5-10]